MIEHVHWFVAGPLTKFIAPRKKAERREQTAVEATRGNTRFELSPHADAPHCISTVVADRRTKGLTVTLGHAFATQHAEHQVFNSPAPAPECQIEFNHGRREAEAKASRFEDIAAIRAQTIRMYGRLSEFQNAVSERNKVDFACQRGCNYCCHLRVEIRPHGAFVLAHHIQTRFTAEQRTRALLRIEQTLERIESLTPEQHIRAGIPCALLEDGVCSAYEARPSTCRKYYSVSVDTCRNAYENPSAPLTGEIEDDQVRMAGNAVALGYAQGLEDAGYDIKLYELHYALHSALTNPKAAKRYRQGKRAFVGA